MRSELIFTVVILILMITLTECPYWLWKHHPLAAGGICKPWLSKEYNETTTIYRYLYEIMQSIKDVVTWYIFTKWVSFISRGAVYIGVVMMTYALIELFYYLYNGNTSAINNYIAEILMFALLITLFVPNRPLSKFKSMI